MDIKLNQTFSNKQLLLFKIIKVLENKFYDIQFEIDGLILTNQFYFNILRGDCLHTNIKYKKNPYLKVFYHHCEEQALLCNSRTEFQNNYYAKYKVAMTNGWLDSICFHMINPNIIWDYETCKEKALLFSNRKEFQTKLGSCYRAAYNNGWLDSICSHMKVLVNQLEFPRIIYIYKFSDNCVYIGLTKDFKIRDINRRCNNNDCVMQHQNKTGLIPEIEFLTDYIPAEEAQRKEQEFIDKYQKEGFTILNRRPGGSLGGYNILTL